MIASPSGKKSKVQVGSKLRGFDGITSDKNHMQGGSVLVDIPIV
jgi:hypothetical protein